MIPKPISIDDLHWDKKAKYLSTEASTLGFPPGRWPQGLRIKGKFETHYFVMGARIEGGHGYEYYPELFSGISGRVVKLLVFND